MYPLTQFTDLVDSAVTGGVYLDNVQMGGFIVIWQGIDFPGKYPGHAGLAYALRAGKKIGMVDTP